MSGLLALLDDVAAIAKLASSQLDDITAQAARASSKAVGVVIDDAAVTPKYVTGLPAARELPIVFRIGRASLFNKLVILLPVLMLLHSFAPWVLIPLLMLGGCYLCFEGAEKVHHWLTPHHSHGGEAAEKASAPSAESAEHLEEQRVAGAIKTDFILSAEIMTISLSAIQSDSVITSTVTLAVVAVVITLGVYGVVALLVKADDVGLRLGANAHSEVLRKLGRGIVAVMPLVLAALAFIGTLAMLWVGGNIIVHGLHQLGWHLPEDLIKAAASSVSTFLGVAAGFVTWAVIAALDGVVGLMLGLLLIPIVNRLLLPLYRMVKRQ